MTFNPDPLLTLRKKIEQNEAILTELSEAQQKDQLAFTHDTRTDFMGRQRLFQSLKDRRTRIEYFKRQISQLKKQYENLQQNREGDNPRIIS